MVLMLYGCNDWKETCSLRVPVYTHPLKYTQHVYTQLVGSHQAAVHGVVIHYSLNGLACFSASLVSQLLLELEHPP